MDTSRLGNLFFLLSTASIAAGCSLTIDGSDDAASNTGTGGESDGTGTPGGTSSDEGSGGSWAPDTTGDASAGGESTGALDTGGTSAVDGTTGSESTGGSGGAQEACESYAAKYLECFPDYAQNEAEFAANCAADIETLEGECRAAFEDYYACLGTSDCAEWATEEGPCAAEAAALDEVCP